MTNTEKAAMDLINEVLMNPKLPTETIKTFSLQWEDVLDKIIPMLKIEYYEESET